MTIVFKPKNQMNSSKRTEDHKMRNKNQSI